MTKIENLQHVLREYDLEPHTRDGAIYDIVDALMSLVDTRDDWITVIKALNAMKAEATKPLTQLDILRARAAKVREQQSK